MAEKLKNIWDYFEDSEDYPSEIVHNPLPYGTVWCYISSTFLNGIINYVTPISCYVIDRYTADDEVVREGFTKRELINSIVSGENHQVNLHCFQDDIIILAKIKTNEKDDGKYIFFWFDCDVSDCCIGKFETEDSQKDVINSVKNWLDERKEENKDFSIQPNMDNGILNYTELPLSFLKGWLSF